MNIETKTDKEIYEACEQAGVAVGDIVWTSDGSRWFVAADHEADGYVALVPVIQGGPLSANRCLFARGLNTERAFWPIAFSKLSWVKDHPGYNPFTEGPNGRFVKQVTYATKDEIEDDAA